MRQKTKITVAAMAVMLVMALAVTVISFSFAENGSGSTENGGSEANEPTEGYTNIDYIIKNSNDASLEKKDDNGVVISDDREYRIVEIGSGEQSTLGDYVIKTDGSISTYGFEDHVINGNKSALMSEFFANGKVVYHYFDAKDVTSTSAKYGDTTDLAIISQADMIYISNNKKPGYASGNDISDDLLTVLQPMAIGKYIPIIIDMPGKSGSNGGGGGTTTAPTTTFGNVIGDYYSTEGKYYYTYAYDNAWTADQFFDSSLGSPSGYLTINAKVQFNNGKYDDITVSGATAYLTKILVISDDGQAFSDSTSMSKKLLPVSDPITGATYTGTSDPVSGNIYDISSTKLYSSGYNVRYSKYNPKYALIEEKSVTDIAAMESLESYEFIFIESDVKDKPLSTLTDASAATVEAAKVEKLLKNAMYGNIHIAYAKSASDPSGAGGSGSSGNGTNTEANNTNYKKFYDMLASSDVASYQNVMLTDKTKIDTITSSGSDSVAKPIADLINASSYRGIGGPGSSASMFSVLEIQPCYPIDERIAYANNPDADITKAGSYYTDPDGVINGLSREEIEAQRKAAGLLDEDFEVNYAGAVDVAKESYAALGFEYYAWELSKAKIADALNLSATNINLVQMSAEEFSSNKDEIFGNYDIVYIGGNTSAIKDVSRYSSIAKVIGPRDKDQFFTKNYSGVTAANIEKIRYAPVYRMYSHNGDMTTLEAGLGGGGSGTPLLRSVNGTTYNTATTSLNGNDISSDNLENLKKYVDAGMPIIFSEDVTAAYHYMLNNKDGNGNATGNRYLQNSIDPDSNMCKLLDYCNEKQAVSVDSTTTATNVLWNFDASGFDADGKPVYASSDNGRLSIYANKVRVLNEDMRTALSAVYNSINTSKRPKLVVTDSPKIYNFFDESTIIKESTLIYKIDASAIGTTNYKVNLYFDGDGNSIFNPSSEDAKANVEKINNDIVVTANLSNDFYGPLYWKLELIDESKTQKPTVFVTGLSYVRPDTAGKQDASILQVLPGTRIIGANSTGEGTNSLNSLYFCVDCQNGYKNLYYNPMSNGKEYGTAVYWYDYGYTDNGIADGYLHKIDYSSWPNKEILYKAGLHEHNFGIVSYDSNKVLEGNQGADVWSHNLADDLKRYFNFDVDIMYAEELERYATDIKNIYSQCVDEADDTDETLTKEELSNYYKGKYTEYKGKYDAQLTICNNAAAELENIIRLIPNNPQNYSNFANVTNSPQKVRDIVDGILARKNYSELFCAFNGQITNQELLDAYNTWVTEHDKLLLLKGGYYVNSYTSQYLTDEQKALIPNWESFKNDTSSDGGIAKNPRIMGYKDYQKFANYGDWMGKTYTSVVFGAAERFADADITGTNSLAAIDEYVKNGGQVILFHDTLSPYTNSGAVKLTEHLREAAGLDKYHLTTATANDTSKYPVLATKNTTKYPSSVYFMSNISYVEDDAQHTAHTNIDNALKAAFNNTAQATYVPGGYTDSYYDLNGSANEGVNAYKYVPSISWSGITASCQDAKFTQSTANYATDKAKKNNDAIVTMFPFQLADEIYIAGTHPQAFATDVDYDNLTVLYSFVAGTSSRANTATFAANPGDGTDNYFIYSCDNIYMCGAGHEKVTGMTRNNLNERYLYLNIICNAVRKSPFAPTIEVYDPNSVKNSNETTLTNNIVKNTTDGSYTYQLEDGQLYPNFSFITGVDSNATVSRVEIYYNLHYGQDPTAIDSKEFKTGDVMIASWEGSILPDTLYYVKNDEPSFALAENANGELNFKIQDSYFDASGCAYIIIKVTDSNNNYIYQRIKITRKDKLYNLT